MKRFMLAAGALAATAVTLTACNDAEIASANISRAADNFEVMRRVVFMNGITDNYMLEIIGLCSINDRVTSVQVTCKIGEDEFIRHQMGLSDNVTYVAEQLDAIDVSVDHYRVTFKPQAIIPDVDLRGSFDSLINDDSDTMNQ
jgi:predicted small secreted protein